MSNELKQRKAVLERQRNRYAAAKQIADIAAELTKRGIKP